MSDESTTTPKGRRGAREMRAELKALDEEVTTVTAANVTLRAELEAARRERHDPEESEPVGIVDAMATISGELARHGIAKDQQATGYGAGYLFRGIDDVQKALAPLLAANGVTITPEAQSCEMGLRQTAKGGVMYHALLLVRFTLRHKDGSSYTGAAFGEACDTGDKAVGKAASYAFKSFALQAFCVPTKASEDPDATIQEPSKPVDYETVPFLGSKADALDALWSVSEMPAFGKLMKEIAAGTFTDEEKTEIREAAKERRAELRGPRE